MIINTLFVIDQAMLGEHGAFNAGAVATARERLHRREEVVWKMEPSNKKQRDVPCTSRCYLFRIMGTVLVIPNIPLIYLYAYGII